MESFTLRFVGLSLVYLLNLRKDYEIMGKIIASEVVVRWGMPR